MRDIEKLADLVADLIHVKGVKDHIYGFLFENLEGLLSSIAS